MSAFHIRLFQIARYTEILNEQNIVLYQEAFILI